MFTEEDVRVLLENSTDQEILASNTKATLSEMYMAVYGCVCFPSSWRKQDILQSLREYFANAVRTQDLVTQCRQISW